MGVSLYLEYVAGVGFRSFILSSTEIRFQFKGTVKASNSPLVFLEGIVGFASAIVHRGRVGVELDGAVEVSDGLLNQNH